MRHCSALIEPTQELKWANGLPESGQGECDQRRGQVKIDPARQEAMFRSKGANSIAGISNFNPAVSIGAAPWPENSGAPETVRLDCRFQMQRLTIVGVGGIDGKFT